MQDEHLDQMEKACTHDPDQMALTTLTAIRQNMTTPVREVA